MSLRQPDPEAIRQLPLTRELRQMLPRIPAPSAEDQMAREIVAEIEREDGFTACAEQRLRGAYDGDPEHRIALAAIRRAREAAQ